MDKGEEEGGRKKKASRLPRRQVWDPGPSQPILAGRNDHEELKHLPQPIAGSHRCPPDQGEESATSRILGVSGHTLAELSGEQRS